MAIEQALFDVAEALHYPVLILALASLAIVIMELGALAVELARRRHRSIAAVERATEAARQALSRGDERGALIAVRSVAWNEPMRDAIGAVIDQRHFPDAANRVAKRLADYDYRSLRRLERTRILVRAGPALGLMGTLIPLSPALGGLAEGNVTVLTDNLRVAFSVTVAGLLIGAIAFGISLIRDRLYAQDFSDVEYVSASLSPAEGAGPTSPPVATPVAGEVATGPADAGWQSQPAISHPAPPIHPAYPPAGQGASTASSTDPLTGYSP